MGNAFSSSECYCAIFLCCPQASGGLYTWPVSNHVHITRKSRSGISCGDIGQSRNACGVSHKHLSHSALSRLITSPTNYTDGQTLGGEFPQRRCHSGYSYRPNRCTAGVHHHTFIREPECLVGRCVICVRRSERPSAQTRLGQYPSRAPPFSANIYRITCGLFDSANSYSHLRSCIPRLRSNFPLSRSPQPPLHPATSRQSLIIPPSPVILLDAASTSALCDTFELQRQYKRLLLCSAATERQGVSTPIHFEVTAPHYTIESHGTDLHLL